jgi:hypothetical protein
MSRWDALKPTDSSSNNASNDKTIRRRGFHDRRNQVQRNSSSISELKGNNHHNRSQQQHQQKWQPSTRLQSGCHSDSSSSNNNRCGNSADCVGVLRRYADLHVQCHSSKSASSRTLGIIALARLVAEAASAAAPNHLLPPEHNATAVVRDIFLPALGSATTAAAPANSTNTGSGVRVRYEIVQALKCLFKVRSHASAMLAPLTQSVSDSGHEQVVVNPVRCALFQALQAAIRHDMLHDADTSTAAPTAAAAATCECFTLMLNCCRRIDCGSQSVATSTSAVEYLEISVIEGFLARALAEETTQTNSLQLLLAVLQFHPASGRSLAKLLLFQDVRNSTELTATRNACRQCNFCGSPDFLRQMHAPDPGLAALSMQCAAQLLAGLPLALWLQDEKPNPLRSRTFRDRVVAALLDLLQITGCVLRSTRLVDDNSLASLVKSLLTHVPCYLERSLLDRACMLVETVALEQRQSSSLCEVLVQCLGGYDTPDGRLTTMCAPMATWLEKPVGRLFVHSLLAAIPGSNGNNLDGKSSRLICGIVRSKPDTILNDESTWSSFRQAVLSTSRSDRALTAVQLIEALMHGRRDFGTTETTIPTVDVLIFVLSCLESTLSQENAILAYSACAALGSMLSSDWNMLQCDVVKSFIDQMVQLCVSRESTVKLKNQCCKSIGDICENYLASDASQTDDEVTAYICNLVTEGMLAVLADSKCKFAAKSMALFTCGNVMRGILLRASNPAVIHNGIVRDLAEIAFQLVACSEGKISVNAVRCIGFVTCVLFAIETDSEMIAVLPTFQRGTETLNMLVQAYLSQIANGNDHHIGWKQRTRIKKECRAACNAISVIFKHIGRVPRNHATQCLEKPVAALIRCLTHWPDTNDKVIVTALAALRSLDTLILSDICSRSGDNALGLGLIFCCNALFINPEMKQSSFGVHEIALTLRHFMSSVTVQDALFLLHSREASESAYLLQLFEWMVSNQVPSAAFRSFAVAMQTSTISMVIQIEQKFASSTLATDEQLDEL